MMIVRQRVKTLMAFHVFSTFSLLPSPVEAKRRSFSDGAYLHACRVKRAVAYFEQDARQRPSRRPGQGLAGLEIERAVMTGAQETLLLRLWHYGARQVRAFSAERDEVVFARSHQQTLVMLFGISEDQRLADLQVVEFSDLPNRRLAAPPTHEVLRDDPELADDESETGQDHELREVAPRDVMVLRPVNREVQAPLGLFRKRTAVGRYCDLFAVMRQSLLLLLVIKVKTVQIEVECNQLFESCA